MNTAAIYGPDPIHLEGRTGSRYWIHHDYEFTGNTEVDARLSGYPVAVFQPVGRKASDTPIVISLQGIACGGRRGVRYAKCDESAGGCSALSV